LAGINNTSIIACIRNVERHMYATQTKCKQMEGWGRGSGP
jgi:hypothetical protein